MGSPNTYRWMALLLLGLALHAHGQPTPAADTLRSRLVLGARAHAGFNWVHTSALGAIRRTYPLGLELDAQRQFVGQRAWDFCNCYPRAGGALSYWNFDAPAILGHGIRAVGFVEPVFLTRHRLQLGIRMGGGLALLTQPFDSVTNPLNQAYSTYLNFPLFVDLALHLRLDPHWSLRLGLNYNHVSNGGLSLPNKGLNYPTASLGADYAPMGIDFKARARNRDRQPPDPRLRLYTGVGGSLKRPSGADNFQAPVWSVWGNAGYYVGRWSGLNLGLEWVSDGARRIKMEREGIPGRHERGAVLVGHQFLLGRVLFSQQLGIYVFDQFKLNDPVFQRYGLGLHVTKRLLAGISLKAHRHVADLLELRIAWGFWKSGDLEPN